MKNSKEELPERISKIKALAERRFVARAKDIKSIRFYDKTDEKERNALTVPKKIVGKVHLTI